MKRLLYICVLTLATILMVGCQDWLDVNTSKDAPVTVTCEEVLPSVLFYATQGIYDFAEYGTYLSQALTTGGKATSGSYPYKVGWGGFLSMNRHPQWRRHYYDVGVNCQYLEADAESKGARNYILISRTLQLNSLMLTTDLFGDMPLSDAYKANNPKYDTQEQIYEYLEEEFKNLLALYDDPEWTECPTNGIINSRNDRMFSGDLTKWRALTKGLYARFLVRQIPNMDCTPQACDRIINAVDDALNDPGWVRNQIWTSADAAPVRNPGGAVYKFDGGTAEKCCQWGPSQPKMNLGWAQARDNLLNSAIPSAYLASILGFYPKSLDLLDDNFDQYFAPSFAMDPRAQRMMEARQDGSDAKLKALRSIRANYGMDNSMKITYYPDLFCTTDKSNPYTRDDGYIAWITEEELLFIKAEAQYWKGNKSDAYETTRQAVEISMERYNVYDENIGADERLIENFYLYRLPAGKFTIANLMQQKYVALYLQPEQWSDIRRYNYSAESNGIQYDNVYVYDVQSTYSGEGLNIYPPEDYLGTFYLIRPYNLYEAHWVTANDLGMSYKLSPNAWVNRISPDPETEEKYNRDELERLGAYKNPDWLRKRMIWQQRGNTSVVSGGDATEWM